MAAAMDESELNGAICAYVDEAKRIGWEVERVIVQIKRFAQVEDGTLARMSLDAITRADAQRILSRAITRCVEHYYWSA
jgi:hypothetical protein